LTSPAKNNQAQNGRWRTKFLGKNLWFLNLKFKIKLNKPNHFAKLIKVNKQMAEIILWNNIQWDRELLKQVQCYKQDGTFPRLVDRNFREIVTIETSGKITFSNKGITYEILPYEDIGGRLDSIMANPPWLRPSLQAHPGSQPVRYLLALCYGISKQGYGAPNTPMHPAA